MRASSLLLHPALLHLVLSLTSIERKRDENVMSSVIHFFFKERWLFLSSGCGRRGEHESMRRTHDELETCNLRSEREALLYQTVRVFDLQGMHMIEYL